MRRVVLVGAALVLAAVGALWYAPRWLLPLVARAARGCLFRVETTATRVALTLDDGPDPHTTPAILDVLRAHRARATFFLIGERAARHPETVAAIVAAGHELGNHTMEDRPSIRLAPAEFERSLAATDSVLSPFAPVRWFRPASGWYDAAMLAAARRRDLRCALGSVYPYDPAIPSSTIASAYILAKVRPGDVIVLHDAGARGLRTAATLRRILPELHRRGLEVTTLTDLIDRR